MGSSGKTYTACHTECDMMVGDGTGSGNEIQVDGKYTIKECIAKVRKIHPTANGITVTNNCEKDCKCYAEYKMNARLTSRSGWQSCYLTPAQPKWRDDFRCG